MSASRILITLNNKYQPSKQSMIRAMTFLEIASIDPETIRDAIKNSQQDSHKNFLALLLNFKLNLNNTNYNYEALSAKLDNLLNNNKPNYHLKAAVRNLQALICHQIDKNYAEADKIYKDLMLIAPTPMSTSHPAIFANFILLQSDINNIHETNIFIEDALKYDIPRLHPQTPRETLAVFYFSCARIKAIQHNPEASILYKKGMEHWPENNVIAMDAAVMLSHMNDKKSLLISQSILSRLYPKREKLLEIRRRIYSDNLHVLFTVPQKPCTSQPTENHTEKLNRKHSPGY